MLELTRLPDSLKPLYRAKQTERLTRNLRVSLVAGAVVALGFLPWTRMHDQTDQLPTMELGIALAAGLLLILGLTFLKPFSRYLEYLNISAYLFCLTMAAVILVILPNGFLYGVGTLLSFTVVATVLAIDLSGVARSIMAVSFLLIPNSLLAVTDAPWLTFMNTNWILVSGGMIAFGLAVLLDESNRKSFILEYELAREKERGDALLNALLPAQIARRLQETEDVIADIEPGATVLFADLVGFTSLTRSMSPEDLINLLTSVFTTLDELASDHGLEKIKTIGDAYMVAAGVADAKGRSSADVAAFALEAIDAVRHYVVVSGVQLDLRAGMASGPVVSGVIGRRKPYFDLWGPTVNLASRLEASSLPGRVHLDRVTAERLSPNFEIEPRGTVWLAGFGDVETCLLADGAPGPFSDEAQVSTTPTPTLPH